MISIIFVLFLISEHGILSCSLRSNIFLFIALWAVLILSFVYLETMFGSLSKINVNKHIEHNSDCSLAKTNAKKHIEHKSDCSPAKITVDKHIEHKSDCSLSKINVNKHIEHKST